MAYGKKAHLTDNIEAIATVFRLEKEGRKATASERKILSRYSGFGGLKCILNPARTLEDSARWTKSELELFPQVADLHRLIRENAPDERMYNRYVDSLKQSVLTAFYTPPVVVESLVQTLRNHGITPARLLEPSAGTGAFVDAFNPEKSVETVAFEKDLLTGKILQHLHPDANVRIEGFENIEAKRLGSFDLAASNIPFGDVSVFDLSYSQGKFPAKQQAARSIHNYFFLKGLDTLQEGGILAFITSQGVMNSERNALIREYLMENSRLISAVRLPNNLFSDFAGTEVGTDLIVLQKQSGKSPENEREILFTESEKVNGISQNLYFDSPEKIISTREEISTDMYGKPGVTYYHDGGMGSIAHDLEKALTTQIRQSDLDVSLFENQKVKSVVSFSMPRSEETKPENRQAETFQIPSEYAQIKQQHPDAVLLFRVDEYYETYQNDAEKSVPVLGLPLIKNNEKDEVKIRFKSYELDAMLPQLVRSGLRVAIADVLEQKIENKIFNKKSESEQEEKSEEKSEQETEQKAKQEPEQKPEQKSESEQNTNPNLPKQEDLVLSLYDLFGFTPQERSQIKPLKKGQKPRGNGVRRPMIVPPKPTVPSNGKSVQKSTQPSQETMNRVLETALRVSGTSDLSHFQAEQSASQNVAIETVSPEPFPTTEEMLDAFFAEMDPRSPSNYVDEWRLEIQHEARLRNAPQPLEGGVTVGKSNETFNNSVTTTFNPTDFFGTSPALSVEPRPYPSNWEPHYREGCLTADLGQVGYLKKDENDQTLFHPLEVNAKQQNRTESYILLRDVYKNLYAEETESKQANPVLRNELNRFYDDFTRKFGWLNTPENLKVIKMDTAGSDMPFLERNIGGIWQKADIFSRPVSFSIQEITKVETVEEALSASLNKLGRVDLDYMASLYDSSREEMKTELHGRIFFQSLGARLPNCRQAHCRKRD